MQDLINLHLHLAMCTVSAPAFARVFARVFARRDCLL